jgi:hypothetical protein
MEKKPSWKWLGEWRLKRRGCIRQPDVQTAERKVSAKNGLKKGLASWAK